MISTCRTSKNSRVFKFAVNGISFKWNDTPDSLPVPITSLPMPRMEKLESPKLVAVKDTLPALNCRSDGPRIWLSRSMSPVNAVTAMGTSCASSGTR